MNSFSGSCVFYLIKKVAIPVGDKPHAAARSVKKIREAEQTMVEGGVTV